MITSEIEEFAQQYNATNFRNGFFQFQAKTPIHTFHYYFGAISDEYLLTFCFRDENSSEAANRIINSAIMNNDALDKSIACKKFPIDDYRFDAVIFLGPGSHKLLSHRSPSLQNRAIEGFLIFDCEFLGSESPEQLLERRRLVSSVNLNRDPAPYFMLKCQIPDSGIEIDEWYNCAFSELETYLSILSEYKRGSLSVKNIKDQVYAIEPTSKLESNIQNCRKHVVCI